MESAAAVDIDNASATMSRMFRMVRCIARGSIVNLDAGAYAAGPEISRFGVLGNLASMAKQPFPATCSTAQTPLYVPPLTS